MRMILYMYTKISNFGATLGALGKANWFELSGGLKNRVKLQCLIARGC